MGYFCQPKISHRRPKRSISSSKSVFSKALSRRKSEIVFDDISAPRISLSIVFSSTRMCIDRFFTCERSFLGRLPILSSPLTTCFNSFHKSIDDRFQKQKNKDGPSKRSDHNNTPIFPSSKIVFFSNYLIAWSPLDSQKQSHDSQPYDDVP